MGEVTLPSCADDAIRLTSDETFRTESGSSEYSWLMHFVPRLLQLLQTSPVNMQRTLRFRHSQQLWVPLRTFLRLELGSILDIFLGS